MTETRRLPVPEGLVGERADAALSRLLGLSRTKVVALLTEGLAQLDGVVIGKSDRMTEGLLDVTIPGDAERAPEEKLDGGIPVVYEDEHVIIVDKPVGVAAHPSPGWSGPTVPGQLTAAGVILASAGPSEREGIVHRLDVGTSGLMAVAKTDLAYSALKEAFRNREVDKTYHAVAQGHPDPTSGTVDAPIGRHPHADYRFAVTSDGKPSITHYEVLEMMPAASLLEINLETGRTHQIRVHMAALRHPLVGDITYGADPSLAKRAGLTRQWLHAVRLSFTHPATGERLEVSSDYPDDLAAALTILRG